MLLLTIQNQIICLVNTPDIIDYEHIGELATYAIEYMQDKFLIKLSIVVGSKVHSLSDVYSSYKDAIQAEQYASTLGVEKRILLWDDLKGNDTQFDRWNDIVVFEAHYNNLINTSSYDKARAVLDSYLNELSDARDLSFTSLRLYIAALVGIVVASANTIPRASENVIDKRTIRHLCEASSLPELRKYSHELLGQMEEYEQSRLSKEPTLAESMKLLVEQNYLNSEMSVSLVAESLDISLSHASRVFKDSIGVGLLDYIHELRIQYAKHLLNTTDFSIKTIATKSGYSSPITMSRAFRKIEGVTPSEYRAMPK